MALSDVVVISVTCAVTVFLSVLLITVLCLRFRQQKNIHHSTNGRSRDLYPQSRGRFQSSIAFPYAGTRQWSAISSMENIPQQGSIGIPEPPPCLSTERRFLRTSVTSTRNSRRLQKKRSRDIPLESFVSSPAYESSSDIANIGSFPHDAAELRADSTPKSRQQTQQPQQNDNIAEDVGGRITSWPQTTRKGSYYDITATMRGGPIANAALAKRLSESILQQIPGSPPKQPVPPLPSLRPPGVPQLTRHDSMLLSNKSLDTAGSSILDDVANETGFVDLEAARSLLPRTHERYGSAYVWDFPSSSRGGSVSRISKVSSPRRYSSTSASSHKHGEERPSPRRSVSMHYPSYVPSGPWIQSSIHGEIKQPPCIYDPNVNKYSRVDGEVKPGHGLVSSSILKPVTENRKNRQGRPQRSAGSESPTKRSRGADSLTLSISTKTTINSRKKGHKRENSGRLSIGYPGPASLSPTIEESEEISRQATPQATASVTVPEEKASSKLPSAAADSQNPFDNDEHNLADDEADTTPTSAQCNPTTEDGVSKASPTPIDEKPTIPRRSSLRRNSTSTRSQFLAQYQPTRSSSITPTTTTRKGQRHPTNTMAGTLTNIPICTTPRSVSGSSSLKSYSDTVSGSNEQKSHEGSNYPMRNAFALLAASPQTDSEMEESWIRKPRPLPILPLPLMREQASSRPPKFRAALATIQSISNIAIQCESDEKSAGAGENFNNEKYGIDSGKDESGSGSTTPTASPSKNNQRASEKPTADPMEEKGMETPSEKLGWCSESLASTPLKAGMEIGAEQMVSSLVRTPGSIYDQFGFLKE
ncbi:hypothetical protein PAAG_04179 [Paracoccidioides lutzii Pb01]|uniref:Uncharacterized protein n=1 Tax=Paracoccidioides lutzii (strain ATCC MYA-826 / Pb01) TaxID=502779 RepID=C1H085_PARBA|nr:hypothetical protein PAAG_04179 [Paracoccidioides lutzii Pb01]EEH33126.2 hypothetical protein PAAG_04179 [Paracoccidioides lutzii Pb01]